MKWKILDSKSIFSSGLFNLRQDRCELPDKRVMPRYYVFEFPDWVNVVALTKQNELVLVRQHRHAAGLDFLEIPGGSTHPDQKESAQLAAARELIEETGYQSNSWIKLGEHYPNPALQNNRLVTFLALDCERVSEPNLDPFEDLTVELMPLKEGIKYCRLGGFQHSLIAASFQLAIPHLEKLITEV